MGTGKEWANHKYIDKVRTKNGTTRYIYDRYARVKNHTAEKVKLDQKLREVNTNLSYVVKDALNNPIEHIKSNTLKNDVDTLSKSVSELPEQAIRYGLAYLDYKIHDR